MALTVTTLASAKGANDLTIKVASATGAAIGNVIRIDNEFFTQSAAAIGTVLPVICGLNGSAQEAHASGARVIMGLGSDFQGNAVGQVIPVPYSPVWLQATYSAAGAIAVPNNGNIEVDLLAGTAAAMTLVDPTAAQEGLKMTILALDAQAYTVTNTTGFNGGSTSSDVATFNGTKGSSMTIEAKNLQWLVLNLEGVSLG